MDPSIETHLLSICNALGAYETQQGVKVYVPGDEVVDCLKDIKRYLREEEGSRHRHIFLALGRWKTVEHHLLPLICSDLAPPRAVSLALELMVPLTWPVDFNTERVAEQLECLISIKCTCVTSTIFQKILKEIMVVLAKDYSLRTEREQASVQMMLTLIKNIIAIKPMHANTYSSAESHLKTTASVRIFFRIPS